MGRTSLKLLSIGLVAACLLACISAHSAPNDKRIQEISQLMIELGKKAQACGQDMDCLKPIQQQLQALAKEYSELKSPAGPQPASASSGECPPSEPCCRVERAKEWARTTNGVDPTWVEGKPVEIKAVWDFHEADKDNDIRFSVTYEFTGCLLLVYDQQKKGVLEDFDLYGPSTSSMGSCHLDSISAKLTAVQNIFLRTMPVNSGNPSDFEIDHSADMHVPKPDLVFGYDKIAGGDGRLGAYGPIPRDSLFPEGWSWPNMHFASYTYSQLEPEQCITLEEIRQALKTGTLVKQIQLRDKNDIIPQFWHLEEGKVTITVSLKPQEPGSLVVTPGDGFSSNRPDPKKPFAPLSKTYTLKNTGDQGINYSVAKKVNWLNLDGTSGSIPPKGSATVTVSVNVPVASKLLEDTYKDTVSFTNTTNGKGNTTRPAEVTLGEEQKWRVTVKGWERETMAWDGLTFTDESGKKTKFTKAVKFDWLLTGEFTIRKDRGKWVYKEGKVTVAKLTPAADFQPKHLYDCSIGDCLGKAKFATYVGEHLVGTMTPSNRVLLRWWPRNPAACVSCKPKHPNLPKDLYEAQFESKEFISQISAQSYPLLNKTFAPVKHQDWLYYTVTLQRLK